MAATYPTLAKLGRYTLRGVAGFKIVDINE